MPDDKTNAAQRSATPAVRHDDAALVTDRAEDLMATAESERAQAEQLR